MTLPEEAFGEKMSGLLLYDAIWPQSSEDAESSPIKNKKSRSPALYRKRGTNLVLTHLHLKQDVFVSGTCNYIDVHTVTFGFQILIHR